MRLYKILLTHVFGMLMIGCNPKPISTIEVTVPHQGPYQVGTTNMEIADDYLNIGDDEMHQYLIGHINDDGEIKNFADLLKYPESAFITQIQIPDVPEVYKELHGKSYPVVTYLAYPTIEREIKNSYQFPYHNSQYGEFIDMLSNGNKPEFPEAQKKYPLILLSHGMTAHGIYDVGHAQKLASHGYIVAVTTYGDLRVKSDSEYSFLRPLITKVVLDKLLKSEDFGPHIDRENIGISGFSFGGYTALALSGAQFMNNANSVVDQRIKAAFVGAPWVGINKLFSKHYIFGEKNTNLSNIEIPVMLLFGSNDTITTPSSILPASKLISGPTYVVELVGQGHDLQEGSWYDRDSWELLFFSAYLKNNRDSLKSLRSAGSMSGGNEDRQLAEYQRLPDN